MITFSRQSKQTQLNFIRTQTGNGNFKTQAKLIRTTDFTPNKQRGLLHKAVGLKERITGDVPSLTRKLDLIQPTTATGRAVLSAAKCTYKFTKGTAKAAINTALTAEDAAFVVGKILSPNYQVQVKFQRKQDSNGNYRTNFKFVQSSDFSRKRGVLHKAVGLKERITGDVPSITKSLKASQPATFKGIVGISAARGSCKFVRTTGKAAVNTALGVENLALFTKDTAVGKYKQKLKSELNDYDTGKMMIMTYDAGKALVNHVGEKRSYRFEKKRLKLRKSEADLIDVKVNFGGLKFRPFVTVLSRNNRKLLSIGPKRLSIYGITVVKADNERNKVKDKFKKEKVKFKADKAKFKAQKKSFKASNKSNLRKALMKRHKADYKALKKDFKNSPAKKLNRALKRRKHFQKKIVRLTKPRPIALKPAAKGMNKLKSGIDQNNDVAKAADKTVEVAASVSKRLKSVKLKYARARERMLKSSANKNRAKLKIRESRLKQKSKITRKRTGMKKWTRFYNKNLSVSDNIKKLVKQFISVIKAVAGEAAKQLLIAALPVVFFLLCFVLLVSSVMSIFSESGFVLGTYTAKDNVLSDAVTYYTKVALDFNNNIIDCSKDNKWQSALKQLSPNDKDEIKTYKNTPEEYVFGNSDKFPYAPAEYDFDPFVLWSFLCAYHYDFEASAAAENSDNTYTPDYWTFGNNDKDLIEKLFAEEYSFEYEYIDGSYWSEPPFYTVKPESNGYYTIYDDFSHSAIRPESVASEIWQFEKDGWISYDENTLEILNANDNNSRTGWFLQDQRYPITKLMGGQPRSSFYFWSNGQYCWGSLSAPQPRTSFYWTNSNQEIYWCVTPDDAHAWISDLSGVCLVSFYQKYIWIENATLYYNVKRNCSFTEAAERILSTMDYKDKRLEYFDILLGNDSSLGKLYGNHQSLGSPVDASLTELIADGRIYNSYGYDVQAWNEVHCSINTDLHKAIDISCNTYDNVYAMFDGEITAVDTVNNIIKITSKNFSFWYEEDEHDIIITYCNVELANGLSKGNTVSKGDVIGYPRANHLCENFDNVNSDNIYIHLKIEVQYSWGRWSTVDPRLLFY